MRIQRNVFSYFRNSKISENIPLDSHQDEDEINMDATAEVGSWVSLFIKGLPEKYQEAIFLSEIKGMSQKDLATHLGISYAGAKSRVQRAKEKLKNLFTDCCHIQTDGYGNIIEYQSKNTCKNC